jgi:DNA-binding MarR family transcriptional regulator
VVDRLSARGLVIAANDPNDRRRRAVTLTEQGRRLTEEAIKVAAKITADTLVPLSEEERETVSRLLNRLS